MNISSKYSSFPGCERPKLKQTNSNSSISEEVKTPKGILKPAVTAPGVKPPVPSRTKINEILRGGSTSSEECLGEYLNVQIRDKLSVTFRSTDGFISQGAELARIIRPTRPNPSVVATVHRRAQSLLKVRQNIFQSKN